MINKMPPKSFKYDINGNPPKNSSHLFLPKELVNLGIFYINSRRAPCQKSKLKT